MSTTETPRTFFPENILGSDNLTATPTHVLINAHSDLLDGNLGITKIAFTSVGNDGLAALVNVCYTDMRGGSEVYIVSLTWANMLERAFLDSPTPAYSSLETVDEFKNIIDAGALIIGDFYARGTDKFLIKAHYAQNENDQYKGGFYVVVDPEQLNEIKALYRATEATRIENTPRLPVNSSTLRMEESTSRFSGAIWYDQIRTKDITLLGVGGIGSYVAFLLGRLKPASITIFDPDLVELGNLSGQLYGQSAIGNSKVRSISSILYEYAQYGSLFLKQNRFSMDNSGSKIMICGFDNMEARQIAFHKWTNIVASISPEQRSKYLFIDGRLAAEEFQVFAIQGGDDRAIQDYGDKWLFSDEEAEATVCSYKQTTFMANMIASVMVNLFVNWVANECSPLIPRDVPYFTRYTADTMMFNVEM